MLSQYDLDAVRALRYPTVNFSTGYNLHTVLSIPWEANSYSQTNGLNWGFKPDMEYLYRFRDTKKDIQCKA